ncbi:Uncharacterized protein FWK35_00016609 [Aphis craccivora]|uniref:Uncharacterized protein n=1 Tax=Aphis craccivora TaxID=307492 RepID=A0A6G0ZNT1_APHCR|nr:Uncharacterized protein FWK35_00016609 [Aphis craccivora]
MDGSSIAIEIAIHLSKIYVTLSTFYQNVSCMVLYRLGDGVLRHLQVNKNNMVQICLNKRSIRQHYLDLGVLSIRSLYRKIVIINPFYENKRKNRVYNLPVNIQRNLSCIDDNLFYDYIIIIIIIMTYNNARHKLILTRPLNRVVKTHFPNEISRDFKWCEIIYIYQKNEFIF